MAGEKAYLMTETDEKIPLLFNPADLEFSKSLSWEGNPVAGKDAPTLDFKSGESVTFSLKIIFDTTGTGKPVSDHTDKLYALTLTNPKVKGTKEDRNKKRPPWVRFHWGKLKSYKAVVTSMSIKFTYFASDGTPLRAECNVSFKQYEDEGTLPPQNPTSGTPAPHAIRRVSPGEYLDTISEDTYGSSNRWRTIAEANGITDPLDIPPGRMLVIPKLED